MTRGKEGNKLGLGRYVVPGGEGGGVFLKESRLKKAPYRVHLGGWTQDQRKHSGKKVDRETIPINRPQST